MLTESEEDNVDFVGKQEAVYSKKGKGKKSRLSLTKKTAEEK